MKLSHHLTAIVVVDLRVGHVILLDQINDFLRGLLVLGLGRGGLRPTMTAIKARTAMSTSGRKAIRGMGLGS